MNAVAAAASATDSVVYNWPAAKASGSVCCRTRVSWFCRSLIVVEMAKALSTPSAARITPMMRMRPGVVLKNRQRG